MELEERIALLESKLIDAIAEARLAKLLAEKALDRSPSSRAVAMPEPWSEPAPATEPPPIVKIEMVETKPTLAPWYGKKAFTQRREVNADPITDDMSQSIWEDAMEESDV